MNTVYLLRHAKADRPAGVEDHDRPLAQRGVNDAATMGMFFHEAGISPSLVVTSTAMRASNTIKMAVSQSDWNPKTIDKSKHLYQATPAQVLKFLDTVKVKDVMLVGHEPTWSTVLSQLIGGGEIFLPTAACACVSWNGDRRNAALQWLVTPKLLARR